MGREGRRCRLYGLYRLACVVNGLLNEDQRPTLLRQSRVVSTGEMALGRGSRVVGER